MPASLADVLAARAITEPTPIQAATLPDSLAGRDVLGRGRTGSGKTYAFLLPLLARLARSQARRAPKRPRALILAPTRELVLQIDEALAPLAQAVGITSRTIFGGVNQNPQVNALARGVDVVVACPGRLEDLIGQGHVSLDAIEVTVLDEADHMADLGFLPSVKRLLDRTPARGQRLLFSATLDNAVHALVTRYLHQPVIHEADAIEAPVGTMSHHVLNVTADAYLPVLVDLAAAPGRTIVFTRTKHRAKKFARQLNAAGVPTVELQGNMSQNARTRSMDAFHSGTASTLVATDIAARGIHVDDVELVIHADPPVEHKAYLHRSGRTARAGQSGSVVTLMLDGQRAEVRDLARKAGIAPTVTKVGSDREPVLAAIAPGRRSFPGAFEVEGSGSEPSPARTRRPESPAHHDVRASRPAVRPAHKAARSANDQADRAASGSGGTRGSSRRPTASASGSTGGAAAFSLAAGRSRGRRR